MKTPEEVFKQVLISLGFADHKPSQMTNSDYWLCTTTAMQEYADQARQEERSGMSDKILHAMDVARQEEREKHSCLVKFVKDAMVYDYDEWDFFRAARAALLEAGYEIKAKQ